MKRFKLGILFYFLISSAVAQINFLNPDTILTYYSSHYCLVEDFNNDSLDDLIIASQFYFDSINDYKIWMYKQENNNLIFKGKISYPPVYPGLQSISSGDLNNDGLRDLVISVDDTVEIFFQNINCFFNETEVLKFYSGDWVFGLACGDLNNDSLCDIAVSHWREDSLKVFYQQKNGTFTKRTYYKQVSIRNILIIKDINNDGLNDVILSNGWFVSQWATGGNKFSFAIYLQNSTGGLDDHILYKLEDGIYNYLEGIDVGDLNNDGLLDVASIHMDHLYVWYQDSANSLMFNNYPEGINAYTCAGPLGIADFDNNGKKEIVVGHGGGSKISVYESDSLFQFSEYKVFNAWIESNAIQYQFAIGDLNNDGHTDVVTSVSRGVSIAYYTPFTPNNQNYDFYDDQYNSYIYPNPAQSQITINLHHYQKYPKTTLSIYNLQGQPILQQTLTNDNTQIDISQLVPGIYIAKIQTDSETLVKKFIKE